MTRKGFTLVELMTVIIVLSILAGIAVMKYIDLRNGSQTPYFVSGSRLTYLIAGPGGIM